MMQILCEEGMTQSEREDPNGCGDRARKGQERTGGKGKGNDAGMTAGDVETTNTMTAKGVEEKDGV